MDEFTSIRSIINYFIDWLVLVITWIETHNAFVTATATIFIAAFTWALVWATCKLWKVSKEAADAAKKSADVAISTQRAFVLLKEIEAVKLIDVHNKVLQWRFIVHLENSGNTPAINMRIQINTKTSKSDIHEIPLLQEYRLTVAQTRTLGARASIQIGPLPISIDDVIAVYNREKHLYIFGKVVYNDILPNTPLYTEMFCEEIGIIGNPIDPAHDTNITFTSHPIPEDKTNA